jgi:hypothetical protein
MRRRALRSSAAVRVLVSDPAVDLIDERGGRLYVWLKRGRCCGAITTLSSASVPPKGKEFRRVAADDRIELYLPAGLARLPDELQIEVRRFPRRLEAYWNGCAWVT